MRLSTPQTGHEAHNGDPLNGPGAEDMDPAVPESAVRGRIFDIQRMSIHDGPGIRTTVFVKGCPLRCAWCHNPEGIAPNRQLFFTPSLCIGCGFCLRQCPNGAHIIADGAHRMVRSRCKLCFACVAECYARALEIAGKDVSVADVLDEAVKDKPFYDESGGGMTVSGGEPLSQFAFTYRLLLCAKSRGLHTCLDTSGFGPAEHFDVLVPVVDLFLFDFKESDPARHLQFTGQSNDAILRNLRRVDALGGTIVLRCILIPEVNVREDHLRAIADLSASLDHCRGIELAAYHPLGETKRQRLGLLDGSTPATRFSVMSREEKDEITARLQALAAQQVSWL